ncbi:motility associated factor glycosyltransferase family protein [Aliarcobacter cryaerophilus]|uniref:motility associated factor glycosyltransferase family protein n=1 Tax=Aliarcobacter cryaerophilus TaxID=28198 RepID=UPI003DA60E02
MTEAQIQLQNALTTTFLANLAFLSEYDKELYHRVDELSRMIENGSYEEKYHLEFIMEDGDFDIYDVVNDKYLYGRKPKKFNNDLIQKVEFDEKNSILNIENYFALKHKIDFDRDRRFELNNSEEFLALTYCDALEYTNCLNDYMDTKKKKFKKIEKFVFLGTLLGRHIPKIAQKIDATMYLVLERNLEIFRLSLFTVDYTILGKKGVIFSVMNDYLEEEKRISEFFYTRTFDNYLIKFATSGINIDKYIDGLLLTISDLSPVAYDYNRILYSHRNRTTKVLNKYKIIQFHKIKDKTNIFKDIPILYIASGPSLDDNMDWIKQNQNKFFIVTIGSAYKKLLKNDIKIGMITTLDELEILTQIQFDDENVNKIDKDTIILASAITNEKVLKKFNSSNLFFYEVFINFFKGNSAFNGFSIGEVTLDLLLHFNAKKIYTIGLDLALNQETGESHSKDAGSCVSRLNLDEVQTREVFDEKTSLVQVKGNLKEYVFTTPVFYLSIKQVEKKIKPYKDSVEIINLSNNGAYFEGTTAKRVEEIDTKEFKEIGNINFKEYLIKNSKESLDVDSKESLKNEINFLDNDIADIIKDIKDKNFKSYEEFNNMIIEMIEKIYKNKYLKSYQFLFEYYKVYIPYLSYHFNDKKIKNESKKVNKIKYVFLKQLEDLINDYKICLERVI